MFLKQLQINQFRCFAQQQFHFESPLVLIEGHNGTGKTSLLEALHYLCYLRSFRTHSPRELLREGHDTFFIKALFQHGHGDASSIQEQQEIQVGFTGKKRLVKINQQVVSSYKELLEHYRIITVTEDDVGLIKEGPDVRRVFLDQLLILHDPEIAASLRTVRHVADSRNRLLQLHGTEKKDLYEVLTHQLWQASLDIQHKRAAALAVIENHLAAMLTSVVDQPMQVALYYRPKLMALEESFEEFRAHNMQLSAQEQRYRRSLFGAHLDDFSIEFKYKNSKQFASRGQQKMLVLLMKIAQMRELISKRGSGVFLLDDFMTDFDEQRMKFLFELLLQLNTQLIFTTPLERHASFNAQVKERGGQTIILSI